MIRILKITVTINIIIIRPLVIRMMRIHPFLLSLIHQLPRKLKSTGVVNAQLKITMPYRGILRNSQIKYLTKQVMAERSLKTHALSSQARVETIHENQLILRQEKSLLSQTLLLSPRSN